MQLRRPSRRLLLIWYLYALLAAAAIAAAGFAVRRLRLLPTPWILAGCGILSALWLAAVAVYLPLRFAHTAFCLKGTQLTVLSGALLRSERVIPLSSVRYVTLLYGPPERLAHICSLAVFVTGGMVLLEGVPLADAHVIQKQLLRKASPYA